MPAGFTSYYVFEFFEGKVKVQPLVTSPDSDSFIHVLTDNPTTTAKAMNKDLWGTTDLNEASLSSIKLPRAETIQLKDKKMKSLAKKYHSIPPSYRSYYPACDDAVVENSDEEDEEECEVVPPTKHKKNNLPKVAPGARVLGRPKKCQAVDSSQPSILRFMVPKIK
jgi:hypothetical protein